MKTVAVIFGLILSTVVVGSAQVKTVTNATLEKFTEKRLTAEREYRENYKRLGLPSPEELDKQRDADMAARIELSEQLRQARIEKERLELERRGLELDASRMNVRTVEVIETPGFYGGYYTGFSDNRRRGRTRGHFGSPVFRRNGLTPVIDRRGAYRVTPFGVIQTPSPQPVFRGRVVRGRRR